MGRAPSRPLARHPRPHRPAGGARRPQRRRRRAQHGAQQIRRAAGELGDEHTYALPGGDRLTLATGDAVRVRVNDYRSRRGQGPDLLNGYRAVVSEIATDGRIAITWRTRTRGQDDAHMSAWLRPDQVASGALSLGYAMTIAASQGMTCDTSLLYGHGANAFATYPGLTRGKKASGPPASTPTTVQPAKASRDPRKDTVPRRKRLTRKAATAILETAELVKHPDRESNLWILRSGDTVLGHIEPTYGGTSRSGRNGWTSVAEGGLTRGPRRSTREEAIVDLAGSWIRIITAPTRRTLTSS